MNNIKNKLVKLTSYLEIAVAIFLVLAILLSAVLLIYDMILDLQGGHFQLDFLLRRVLTLVVGIEFAKMLILHTPESVLEVLLYAVARQIVIYHDSALENLIGVLAVGVVFVVRKYFVMKKKDLES